MYNIRCCGLNDNTCSSWIPGGTNNDDCYHTVNGLTLNEINLFEAVQVCEDNNLRLCDIENLKNSGTVLYLLK